MWWRLEKQPGTRREFGDERKIAAWLAFNVREGDTFTMRDLRRELGEPARPNSAEHLNRRLRNLRPDGWIVFSYRDDASLPNDTYRLKRIGWHPGLGTARPGRGGVSAGMKRRVLERDHRRCVVCFVGGGEPYPGEPGTVAVLTVGHRVPGCRAGRAATLDELQAECQRCNETVRDEMPDPPELAEVRPAIKRLNRDERRTLLDWLSAGHRLRSRVDDVFDLVRLLTPDERARVKSDLQEMLGDARR